LSIAAQAPWPNSCKVKGALVWDKALEHRTTDIAAAKADIGICMDAMVLHRDRQVAGSRLVRR